MFPLEFIERIHNHEITLDEAINDHTELEILINKLNNDYNHPRSPKKAKEKNNVLKSAKKLLNARKDIISFFEKGTFPYRGNVFKTKEKKSEFIKYIENKSKNINYDLFRKHFKFVTPSALIKQLYEIKNRKKKWVSKWN